MAYLSITPNPVNPTSSSTNFTVVYDGTAIGATQVIWFQESGAWASNGGTASFLGAGTTSNATGFGITPLADGFQMWALADQTKSDWAISAGSDNFTQAQTKNYWIANSAYQMNFGPGTTANTPPQLLTLNVG